MRRACTSSTASHQGRKRTGAGVSAGGSGARGRSISSRSCSSRKRRSRNRSRDGGEQACRNAGPRRDVLERGRPEAAEVRPDEMVVAVRLRDRARPDPLLGERIVIRAAPLPRPRRRRADDVLPELRASVELLRRDWAREERRPELRRPPPHLTRGRLVDPQLPFANSPPQACRVRPVLPGGDEVDGRPHQRPLDDRSALESARQLLAAEALETRPQPDVRVRRVLVLDAAQALECAGNGQRRAFEEQLPGEQRPVQLPLGEHALAHGRNASSRSPSASSSSRTGRVIRTNGSMRTRFFSTFQVPATKPSTRMVCATSPFGAMTLLR